MAFIPFPTGTAEVLCNLLLNTVPAQVTMGATFNAGAATASDGSVLATAIINWWTTYMKPQVTSICTLANVTVNDLTSSAGWQSALTAAVAGTHTGNPVPNNAAMTVTFETAQRGRSQRGRIYVPGLADSILQDERNWNSTILASMLTAMNALGTAITAAGWTHVVLSRYHNNLPRTTGQTTAVVTYRPNALIATQRGRLT